MDFCGVSHPGDLAAFCVLQNVVLCSFRDEFPAQRWVGRRGNLCVPTVLLYDPALRSPLRRAKKRALRSTRKGRSG